MKISLHWLQDFVRFRSVDVRSIAERLTASVAEVERIEEPGELLHHCCVGKVISIKKHPRADRLSLCEVTTDRGKKNVVCGGSNLRVGMLVAFAHIGARVRWHGKEPVTLEKATIRGEESEGMICAAEELGLEHRFPPAPSDGPTPIVDLSELRIKSVELRIGQSLRDALGLTDIIFHIDNHAITHRPDLFSHIGFARECVAIGLARWKKKTTNYRFGPSSRPSGKLQTTNFPKTPLPFAIHNDCPTLVPRYSACLLSIDALGTTPLWMRERLEAMGWRSVNLPVDITNYVTMEIGMPLHSFDVQDLKGDIHIRQTSQGEHVTTLDGVRRPLPMGAVVLSDEKGVFDLLGIMGGKRSSMKDATRTVLLHAAAVRPSVIRQTILATGLRTDAATIYEKGVQHISVTEGFSRALGLFLTLVPGARITSKKASWGTGGSSRQIPLSLERASRIIGMKILKKEATTILKNLGCTVQNKKQTIKSGQRATGNEQRLVVRPPLHRLGDLREEHDLIEELARVSGYDRIPAATPSAPCLPPSHDSPSRHLRARAKEEGFLEILPLSLVGPHLLQQCGLAEIDCLQVENTLGEELSLLQPSALPRLLEHAEQASRLTESMLRTFTIANVFTLPHDECLTGAFLLAQKKHPPLRTASTLLLKEHLTTMFQNIGYPLTFTPHRAPSPLAHPAQYGAIHCQQRVIGELFSLRPDTCASFGLAPHVAAASVNLDALFALPPLPSTFRPLPTFPSVSYDVTLSRTHSMTPLARTVEKARGSSPLLTDLFVTDLFDGKPLQQGGYTVTLRCVYQDPVRTLTEEEAKREHEKVTRVLSSQ